MSRDLRWILLLLAITATALNLQGDNVGWAVTSAACAGYWIGSLLYDA